MVRILGRDYAFADLEDENRCAKEGPLETSNGPTRRTNPRALTRRTDPAHRTSDVMVRILGRDYAFADLELCGVNAFGLGGSSAPIRR